MKEKKILKQQPTVQILWAGVVYGILFSILSVLFIQKFDVKKIQLFGANENQPNIFLN